MLLLLKLLRSILLNILAYLNFQLLRGLRQIFDWLSTHQIQNLISSLYSSYVPKYELDTAIYGERLLFSLIQSIYNYTLTWLNLTLVFVLHGKLQVRVTGKFYDKYPFFKDLQNYKQNTISESLTNWKTIDFT